MTLNKHPISWYEEALKNRQIYLEQLKKERDALEIKVNTLARENDVLQVRINKAKRLNLFDFDENQATMREDRLYD